MVEGARLESVYAGNRIWGSNPHLSAMIIVYCGWPRWRCFFIFGENFWLGGGDLCFWISLERFGVSFECFWIDFVCFWKSLVCFWKSL